MPSPGSTGTRGAGHESGVRQKWIGVGWVSRRLEGALRASLETGAAVQTGSGLVRDRERQKKTEERQRGQREDERQCREGQRETERDRECYSSSLYFI